MRYTLLLLPFIVAGCATAYPVGYGYNSYAQPEPYAPGYDYDGANPSVASEYTYNGSGYGTAIANNTENCGTPFDFKACPPMPRRPLAYYPGDRP